MGGVDRDGIQAMGAAVTAIDSKVNGLSGDVRELSQVGSACLCGEIKHIFSTNGTRKSDFVFDFAVFRAICDLWY